MMQFVWRPSQFCAILFCLLGVTELTLRPFPNNRKHKYEWMMKNSWRVEVLLIGASFTEEGIRPDLMCKNTFNMASTGRELTYDTYWA